MSSKDCSEVSGNELKKLQCQHCKKNNILQNSKVWSTKWHEYPPLWWITSPLIPLLMFSFVLQRYCEKSHFKRKNPTYRRKMISLHDFLADSAWPWSEKILPDPGANPIVGFSGYRPLTNRKKMSFFKMPVCFSRNQLAMLLPTEKTRAAQNSPKCGILQWLTRRSLPTDARKWRHNSNQTFSHSQVTKFS